MKLHTQLHMKIACNYLIHNALFFFHAQAKMNRHTVSTSSNKLTYVPELSDDDSSGKENCSGRGGGRPNLYVKDSSDEEFDKSKLMFPGASKRQTKF